MNHAHAGILLAPLLAMPEAAVVGVEASESPRSQGSIIQSPESRHVHLMPSIKNAQLISRPFELSRPALQHRAAQDKWCAV